MTLRQSERRDGLIEIAVEADDLGRPRYSRLHSEGALAVRIADECAWIIGASASPVGDDELRISMSVGESATLSVRSTSATLVRAGSRPMTSHLGVSAVVGKGGGLRWTPEPTIAAEGSSHKSIALIDMRPDSWLIWNEALSLGRQNEGWGSLSSELRIEIEGRPRIASCLEIGPAYPAWSSSAVMDGARSVCTMVIIGGGLDDIDTSVQSASSLLMPLEGGGIQLVAWGDSTMQCKAELIRLAEHRRIRDWYQHSFRFIFEQVNS